MLDFIGVTVDRRDDSITDQALRVGTAGQVNHKYLILRPVMGATARVATLVPMPKSAPSSPRRSQSSDPVGHELTGAGEVHDAAEIELDGDVEHADTAQPGETTLPDDNEFLMANRRERERLRAESQRKANSDRVPRRLGKGESASMAPPRPRRRGWSIAGSRRLFAVVTILVILVIGLGISTGVLAYQLSRADSAVSGPSEAERAKVIDTAKRYAATLSTYSAADYGDLDTRIRAISTPDFAKTFIASSQDARAGNANAKGVSKAVADHGGIESMSAANAVVLVSLDQTVTSPDLASQVPEGIPYQSRVLVTLTKQDGRWLLGGFKVVD